MRQGFPFVSPAPRDAAPIRAELPPLGVCLAVRGARPVPEPVHASVITASPKLLVFGDCLKSLKPQCVLKPIGDKHWGKASWPFGRLANGHAHHRMGVAVITLIIEQFHSRPAISGLQKLPDRPQLLGDSLVIVDHVWRVLKWPELAHELPHALTAAASIGKLEP